MAMDRTETSRHRLLRFPTSVRQDPSIEVWMREHAGELGAIARRWFEVMRACGDDVRELLHDGHPTACVGDAAFGYVNAFREHVDVGFFRGAEIDDPGGLLEGTGRFMRHVKLRPGREARDSALGELIETAYTDMKERLSAEREEESMHRFQTTLVPGKKPPYLSWTFLVIPPELARKWGSGQKAVRGTLAGTAFRGTASRSGGVLRMPVPQALRDEAGVRCGDTVEAEVELDTEPRPVEIPEELQSVFDDDPDLALLYDQLPPAHRRAWATYVAEARRPETRARRAQKAPDGIRAHAFPR
jgi:hypothetical protein